ncbi:MAG: hypothetical protein AAF696_30500 [Bacteroidota bacterium]
MLNYYPQFLMLSSDNDPNGFFDSLMLKDKGSEYEGIGDVGLRN